MITFFQERNFKFYADRFNKTEDVHLVFYNYLILPKLSISALNY